MKRLEVKMIILNPNSSSQIQESWFWGPSDQCGDEERTGVLWTSVLTGYEGDEKDEKDNEEGDETYVKNEGEKDENDGKERRKQ
jgi:hypothetical protein